MLASGIYFPAEIVGQLTRVRLWTNLNVHAVISSYHGLPHKYTHTYTYSNMFTGEFLHLKQVKNMNSKIRQIYVFHLLAVRFLKNPKLLIYKMKVNSINLGLCWFRFQVYVLALTLWEEILYFISTSSTSSIVLGTC